MTNGLVGSGQATREHALNQQSMSDAATPRQNLRGEAGEALIQSERFASQVLRLRGMLEQMGLREQQGEKAMPESACNPNDLNWTIRTTATTIRAANNLMEDLINTLEGELL